MDALIVEFVIIALLAGVVVFICGKIHIPPVVGYLITGAVFGPGGFGLVEEMAAVRNMADIGVVFLMFSIGMGLSVSELIRLKRAVFLGGSIQVGGCIALFAILAWLWGMPGNEAVFLGCLLSLSSTAIIVGVMQQQGTMGTPAGRISLAMNIFQDIATVPMILAIPILAGTSSAGAENILLTLGRTLALAALIFVLSRKVVPKLLEIVVRTGNRELFLITVLGICLGTAYLTSLLGLSLTIGAFMAGIVVAESRYSYNALEGVVPFKDVLTSIFFVSVGMLLDVHFLASHVGTVLALAVLALAVKTLVAGAGVLLLGYPTRPAVIAGLSLCQIGEFSFVLAKSGLEVNLLENSAYQMLLAVATITMLATPPLMGVSSRLADAIDRHVPWRRTAAKNAGTDARPAPTVSGHVMIIGFGWVGQLCARAAAEAKIPYVIIEMNPDTVTRHARAGEPIYYGDAVHGALLEHYGLRRAKALIVAISDQSAVYGVIQEARRVNASIHIIARARFLSQSEILRKSGADEVVAEEFETSIEILVRLLSFYNMPHADINKMVRQVRAKHYDAIRNVIDGDRGLWALRAQMPELTVSLYTVEKGSPLDGGTLADAKVDAGLNISILGVKRDNAVLPHTGEKFRFQAGDIAYVVLPEHAVPVIGKEFAAPATVPETPPEAAEEKGGTATAGKKTPMP